MYKKNETIFDIPMALFSFSTVNKKGVFSCLNCFVFDLYRHFIAYYAQKQFPVNSCLIYSLCRYDVQRLIFVSVCHYRRFGKRMRASRHMLTRHILMRLSFAKTLYFNNCNNSSLPYFSNSFPKWKIRPF